jgi:hypothetical protein
MSPDRPVGIPDPERHRICRRCGKWFDRQEGDLVGPEGRFEQTYLFSTGSVFRFQCKRCTRIRRATQGIILGTFIGLVALIGLLVSLRVIE